MPGCAHRLGEHRCHLIVVIVGLILLSGCAINVSQKASSLAALILAPSPTPTPSATPTPTITPTPSPVPTRSPQDVLQSWADNPDNRHAGLACESCHTANGQYGPPADEACMKCHGGSYGGVTELTKDYLPANPHDYHYTTGVACSFCHKVHKPSVSPCGLCHLDKKISKPVRNE